MNCPKCKSSMVKNGKRFGKQRWKCSECRYEFVEKKGAVNGNVLIIGDSHEPFCRPDYIDHCQRAQDKYKCDTVVHIGDVVDNHAVSYHEADPDGMSSGYEYEATLKKLERWYKAFPNVKVTLGNHTRLPERKAFTMGLSKHFI